MHIKDADQGSACAEKSTEVWLGQLSAGATSASFIAFTAILDSVRHQGRFTKASTDREVDRCNLQDDTVGTVNCGDRISVTEERQGFLHSIFNFESSEAFQSSLRGSNLGSRNQGKIFREKDLYLVDQCISYKEFQNSSYQSSEPQNGTRLEESTFFWKHSNRQQYFPGKDFNLGLIRQRYTFTST